MNIKEIIDKVLELNEGSEELAFFNIHISENESVVAVYSNKALFIKRDFYSTGLHSSLEEIFTYQDGEFKIRRIVNSGGKVTNEEKECSEEIFCTKVEKYLTLVEMLGDCYEREAV